MARGRDTAELCPGDGERDAMTNSAIYEGTVVHARLSPTAHRFRYRVFYLLFDLDELPMLDRRLRWFSHNRFNAMALHDRDHGSDDGRPLKEWIAGTLEAAGFDFELGRVEVLAFPRILGYVFNPISVWYCRDTEGVVRAVLHEVRNTFGDKHCYVGAVDADDATQTFDKRLHVSPFMDMDKRYDFSLTTPGNAVAVRIRESDGSGEEMFRAAFTGRRRELDDRTLLAMFVKYPLVTLKAIGAIHFEAIRLWMKRVPFFRRPAPPVDPVTADTVVHT